MGEAAAIRVAAMGYAAMGEAIGDAAIRVAAMGEAAMGEAIVEAAIRVAAIGAAIGVGGRLGR